MAKLHCESFAERALIPAFVFFFQLLYPFAWVNDTSARTAAAAGGCMLVERFALQRAGGVAKIRGAVIDDCALARVMKAEGAIWLGLSDKVRSLRTYPEIADIGRMVARTAYTQLRYSPLLLAATLAGMAATYLAPPLLAIIRDVSDQRRRLSRLGSDDARLLANPSFLSPLPVVGRRAALDRCDLFSLHTQFGV